MAQKHNDVIHAALLETAATLTSAYFARLPPSLVTSAAGEEGRKNDMIRVFTAMLEKIEHAYDAHLAKHGEK
ncbi:hypothetical protein [Acetobacter fabarum]|uniref:Uncharacterized protein n=1 Tax=Acetobacter fabarum TaxID=483199 RepID=A0A269XZI2_9PROT|nr:hypothetical protein [Acetobacter fabarum]PAK77806.1 hypothetical protein B8X00_09010 [Acetobacter fabarum]PEN28162.1 hypothetical protein CRM93_03815 [Acetobacter fabarum]